MTKKIDLKSDFFKYIVVLMSGTVLAQVMSYLFSPVITRLYTPEEAAELGLFLRIVGLGAALATLKYELVIPIPKNDRDSFRLYQFAFKAALITSLISFLIILVPFFLGGNLVRIAFYLLIPIAIFFSAINGLGTNWSIRNKFFKTISVSKVANSLISGGGKIIFGWLNTGYIGLILATVAGLIISSFWFLRDFVRGKKQNGSGAGNKRSYALAKKYKEFPTINLPHSLIDLGRDLLVAALLLQLFSKETYGLYDHSFRMLKLPLIVIGLALGQVFFQRCAELVNEKKDILKFLKRSVGILTLVSIIPFAIVFFFGEELFAIVFGEAWRGAGKFSELMVPWFMINFVSSPISTLPLTLRRQGDFFVVGLIGSILMIGAITIPPLLFDASIEKTLLLLSLSQAGYLVFVIFRIFGYARRYEDQLKAESN